MLEISNRDVVFAFDREQPPVARCASGQTVRFHTLDCFSNAITSEDQLVTDIDFSRINPATGPLYVEGARPGDTLKVHINHIELAAHGTMIVAPGFGFLGDVVPEPVTKILPVHEEYVDFNGKRVPKRPMIGVIGVAPAGEPVPTGTPHDHGGNMDCRLIAPDTTLYLPVEVEGALLAIGDVHAAMADGEIGVSGVEIAAEVTVTVEVLKHCPLPTPALETPDSLALLCSRPTIKEAARGATELMVEYLQQTQGMSLADAIMLCSAAADLEVCQVVDPNMTMRMRMPKHLLEA